MTIRPHELLAVGLSFGLALVLTPLVRGLHAAGAVARPKADRWHQRPTALLGGVAIFVAVAATNLSSSKNRGRRDYNASSYSTSLSV